MTLVRPLLPVSPVHVSTAFPSLLIKNVMECAWPNCTGPKFRSPGDNRMIRVGVTTGVAAGVELGAAGELLLPHAEKVRASSRPSRYLRVIKPSMQRGEIVNARPHAHAPCAGWRVFR